MKERMRRVMVPMTSRVVGGVTAIMVLTGLWGVGRMRG